MRTIKAPPPDLAGYNVPFRGDPAIWPPRCAAVARGIF
jgi:hypothetical protein